MSINRAILLGHVGQDPEIRYGNNGEAIASFSLATSETWKDKNTGEKKEATEWHRIVVFNPALANVAKDYIKKGSKISVEGMIKTRKWQDKEGHDRWSTEIVIGRFDGKLSLEGTAQRSGPVDEHGYGEVKHSSPKAVAPTATTQTAAPSGFSRDLDDEIPF